jgi:hypothetical protein
MRDLRQKALVLFNFAGLTKKEMKNVGEKVQKKFTQHKVFIDAKYFKKNKYDYNWFSCTVEPALDGVIIFHRTSAGVKQVACFHADSLQFGE